ncbi:unnamed protein product [Calicophoron daubneyi]|uniref:NADP-dependent oxidoreductase domain-containing protein n=1 Tax=Calicophoron daubneyi TaxID=300641 RepID=A0AAV2T3Z1_CALDB
MKTLEFSDGRHIPALGLGTWNSPPEQVKNAVKVALETGYRHIDCALIYGNEHQIGEALEQSMKKLNIKREDIFITSKLWCTYFRPNLVRKACEKTLSDLRIPYLDLYLIHWPVAFEPGEELLPQVPGGDTCRLDDTSLMDTWRAMEKLVDEGLVRSIGVSNFNHCQIDSVLKICRIKPVCLQVEIHANFPNTKLVEYAQSKGLVVSAYSPLGSPVDSPGRTNLLKESWVLDIANKHGKTPAQVLLRWLLQRNLVVIPKSVTPERIVENFKIFDFTLTPSEMKVLSTSGLNERQLVSEIMMLHPEYPFREEF